MAVRKTKDVMVDVARRLFARKGVHSTTMNDIADAAGKGRRTVYTYFKSKQDVIQAVVDRELAYLNRELDVARRLQVDPRDKLINLIYVHLQSMRELVARNGTLRAEFFRDIWQVEQSRSEFDRREMKIIQEILEEGVEKGDFTIPNCRTMAYLLLNAIKGLEVPYICGHIRLRTGKEYELLRENVVQLIFSGICTHSEKSNNIQ